jgi:Fe-S cluster assembly protein SufD
VDGPIHLLFVSTGAGGPTISHPRSLIVAEPESRAVIVETYVGVEGGVYLTNAVTEIVLGQGAAVDYCRLQAEADGAFHVATVQVRQERDSAFSSCSVMLGAALSRNDLGVVLAGERAVCTLDGLYVAAGAQHVDNHTCVEHVEPHGTSRELYKGVLDGRAHGVFNGKVVVRPGAQGTDARQANRNLLLSRDAVVDSKPQLEIFNNDVRCSHASAIGRLDREALFYLRSRGLDERGGGRLLMHAFAGEIIAGVKGEPLRTRLEALLGRKLSGGEQGMCNGSG